MIIPFAAGGPTDVLGRIVGERISKSLGQQVVIENVGGAGGMVGSSRVAKARPDGNMFGIGTVGTHAQGQTLYAKPLYDAATDFQPVILIAQVPIGLLTKNGLPATDLKSFIAHAKANEASSISPRRGPARRRIWRACCSMRRPGSRRRTCPTRARRRR